MRTARIEAVVITQPCEHTGQVTIKEVQRPAKGCEECLKIGGHWVHLRICLVCGKVGCCDSSPNRHATKHYHQTHHAIMTSGEAGESWVWCYVDEQVLANE